MPVQINKEDFAKPWRPGVYPKSTTVIYNNQLWILNDTITGLFTSSDFLAEVANGDWIGKFTIEDDLLIKQNLPTGFITGLELSIKPGDSTKAIIGAGAYTVSDFSDLNNIQVNIIQVTTPIEFTPQYLNTNPASYIALDINQNVIQSSSPFDNDDRRTLALIGATIHSNLTIINVVNEIKAPIVAPTNQLHDLIKAVGSLNLEGNVYYPNGANLQIDKTAGQIWGLGINAQNYLDPHRLAIPAQTGLTFRYRLRNTSLPNGESSDTNLIDPDNYDNAGVKTVVPNNKYTIQRINLFQSGLTRIQYGQTVYNNLDEAKTLVQTETFETEMNIADNAIFRAYLIIKKGVTNLTTAITNGDADFIPVDKFGNVIGGAGIVLNFSNITTGLGYVPEDVANKAIDFITINDTLYPSVKAVKDYVDSNSGGLTISTDPFNSLKLGTDNELFKEIEFGTAQRNTGVCESMGYSFNTLAISQLRTAPSLSTGATFVSLPTFTTDYFSSMRKYGVTSTNVAGQMMGLNGGTEYQVNIGLGFYHSISFGVADIQDTPDARMAIGISSNGSTTANVNPSTLLACILLGNDSGETNLQIMHNDASGTCTKIDLGTNFPANTRNTDWYQFELFCKGNEDVVYYRVTRKNTGHVATGVLTTDIPSQTQVLGFHFKRGNGTDALAVRLAFGQFIRSYSN